MDEPKVKRPCIIVQYGEEGRLCKKCGYVFWEAGGRPIDMIITAMVSSGYEPPNCRKDEYENKIKK